MPEKPIGVVEVVRTSSERLEEVILLSEKSEKILSEYSEQLKNSSFTSLMGLATKGVPDEIIDALDNYQQCNAFFKVRAKKYIANQE